MRNETHTYHWLCSDGGLELSCLIDLDVSLDPENFDLLKINSAYCSTASIQSIEGHFRFGLLNNAEFLAWLGREFIVHHTANRFNLADDLQRELVRKFNVPVSV